MKEYSRGVVWIRRDLRLVDHRALSEATQRCEDVAVVFVFDDNILTKLSNKRDQRITFILESLKEIDESLRKLGSQLIIRHGKATVEVPKVINEIKAQALFFNEDYESYAKNRDHKVIKALKKEGVGVFSYKDQVIFSGKEVLKPDGNPYQVFTPYKKAWLKKFSKKDADLAKVHNHFIDKKSIAGISQALNFKSIGFEKALLPLVFQEPGRKAAVKSIKKFSKYLSHYEKDRDFPYLNNGTSGLSAHLRFGTLSIRECVRMSLKIKSRGSKVWLNELIWRDFYQMILDQYPHVEKTSFKEKYRDIRWKNNASYFKAWCEGRTGFPIVDAGMRQLNQTGWMHNRVRMIVASFLVKDLLVDWRKGERYFAEKLLDYDLASNNGGWQWCASTGCDAQPYFRIFNPSLQSQRFDEEALYIKEWIPELKECSPKDIHFPEKSQLSKQVSYPKPIISHSVQKDKVLELFK